MMKAPTIGTLMLLVMTALIAVNAPGEPQAPATGGTGKTSRGEAKPSARASPSAGGRKIPCKTPENASLCYWTHGRLSIYNGNPSFRIWKTGTHRLLGVFNGPSHFPPHITSFDDDVFNPELAAELYRAYEADNRRLKRDTGVSWAVPPPVFADFEVCPLEPEKKNEMQAVCIESAKNIFIEKDY